MKQLTETDRHELQNLRSSLLLEEFSECGKAHEFNRPYILLRVREQHGRDATTDELLCSESFRIHHALCAHRTRDRGPYAYEGEIEVLRRMNLVSGTTLERLQDVSACIRTRIGILDADAAHEAYSSPPNHHKILKAESPIATLMETLRDLLVQIMDAALAHLPEQLPIAQTAVLARLPDALTFVETVPPSKS